MTEREKEHRDEHRMEYGFGPGCIDLTPQEKAEAEFANREAAEELVRECYCEACDAGGRCNMESICDGFKEEVERVLKEDFENE